LSILNPGPIANNILFPITRSWDTIDGDYRQEISYQIRDLDGGLVKATTILNPPLLPDSVQQDDVYSFTSVVTDNEGKAWVSFDRDKGPDPMEYYYCIIGTDGNLWKGPIQTATERQFRYCDKDGYIWTNENGQMHVLNSADTDVISPRPWAFIPNQSMGAYEANVSMGGDGYRCYDRWSPQAINIDVTAGADFASMEVYDLNLWDNDLHAANINIKDGDSVVWNQSGQFTGYTTIDMSGVLNEGQNLLTMTQDDFLGGQVLVMFPYSVKKKLTVSSSEGGSVIDPGEGQFHYDPGDTVALIVAADINYYFVEWTGTGIDAGRVANPNADSTTIVMDDSYGVHANFATDKLKLTTSSNAGGSVTAPGEGLFMYDPGDTVSIIAGADPHWHFVEWTGTGVDSGRVVDEFSDNTSIIMDDNYTVQANFEIDRHALAISSTDGGSVINPGENTFYYDYGSMVPIQAETETYYFFVEWIGTVADAGKIIDTGSISTTILMDADYTAIAYFALDDSDSDELPDGWEQQIIDADLGDTITTILDVLPADDFDGDGQSNENELGAGTDPTDPNSFILLVSITENDTGNIVLSWSGTENYEYSIYYSADLSIWTFADAIVSGIYGEIPWIDDGTKTGSHPSVAQKRFYKIGISEDGPGSMTWVWIDDPGVPGHEGFNGEMSRYETTNAQYCDFLNSALASGDITVSDSIVYGVGGSYSGQIYFKTYASITYSQIIYNGSTFSVRSREGHSMNNHPVTEISWYGAMAFCDYYGYRLPTEWEWQAVADHTDTDPYTYGCGTTINFSKANYWGGADVYANPLRLLGFPYTSPVNYYPSYGYGMNDMAGNVAEWTDSIYSGSSRVHRGGLWLNSASNCGVSIRRGSDPSSANHRNGFRVCR
jgi:formylglycine-generating enzyme required for sulfatase activity